MPLTMCKQYFQGIRYKALDLDILVIVIMINVYRFLKTKSPIDIIEIDAQLGRGSQPPVIRYLQFRTPSFKNCCHPPLFIGCHILIND